MSALFALEGPVPERMALPVPPVEMKFTQVPEVTDLSVAESEVQASTMSGKFGRVKNAAKVALVATELTPANEAIRLLAYGAGAGLSHNNPIVGGVTAGLSTLAVEGFGALAASEILTSDQSKRAYSWLAHKLKKVGVSEGAELSRTSKLGIALIGGSVVAMAVEQREDPARTNEQNRRFGLVTSAWLSVVCAVGGVATAEGINVGFNNPVESLGVAAGAGAIALGRRQAKKWSIERHTPLDLKSWRRDTDKYGLSYGVVDDAESLRQAAVVEQTVWDEKHYGNLEEEGYIPFINSGRTFGVFDTEGNCIGMNRMFKASETEVTPFLELEFYDQAEKEAVKESALAGLTEELGTVAVMPNFRGKRVNLRLWRMAYRDARERGIQNWGIIMEPERVEKMNKFQGFTFKQMGPAVPYQGGDCAPFIMNLQEVDESMHKQHRLNYYWFAQKKLKA